MTLATKTGEVKFLQQGKRGMLPYPAGEYDLHTSYVCTDMLAPYVLYNGIYYVMNQVTTWVGQGVPSNINNPQKDYAVNGTKATWIPFEGYKAIYVEILMANFAKLASAVFYGQYQFSQYGEDASGSAVETEGGYKDFNPNDPMNSANAFRPNLILDFLTGKVYCKSLDARGSIYTPYLNIPLEPDVETVIKVRGRMNGYITCLGVSTQSHTLSLPRAVDMDAGTELNLYYYVMPGRLAPSPTIKIYPDGEFLPHGLTEFRMRSNTEVQLKVVKIGTADADKMWMILNAPYNGSIDLFPCVLAQGYVTGTSTGATIVATTYDGSSLSVSRVAEGHYRIKIPSSWKMDHYKYIVMLTGIGAVSGGPNSPTKATLKEQSYEYFDVWVSDDSSVNDGSFSFMISDTYAWGNNGGFLTPT